MSLCTPTSASAQWRGYGYRGVPVHGGWGYRGGHYHGGWGWGAAGLIGGLALGALATAPYYAAPAPYNAGNPYYGGAYGYGYYGQPYYGAYRGPGLTRNSSCSDVRANPSLYSPSIWESCGLVVRGSSDWGSSIVR
jgi:hypothetical protein